MSNPTLMFRIRIKTGDKNDENIYFFVHKNRELLSEEEQKSAFNDAVQEINHIYKDYGRFATPIGVKKLFDHFGFERTIP